MAQPPIDHEFNERASACPKDIHVLVLGAGVMGKRHIQSLLEISEKVLEPNHGVKLHLSVVDKEQGCLDAVPNSVRKFKNIDDALAVQKPEVALMAFNDEQHISAFKKLFEKCPGLRAVLSEKPLTETLAEAKKIEPELKKRYLSMNTVINFSPVFDRIYALLPELEKQYGGLKPYGFEGVWGKNRTADTRPSIGIPSESVHALSIVADMFDQDNLRLIKGSATAGYLSTKAADVIYETESVFKSEKTGLTMNFHASYIFKEQERRVTAYYKSADGRILAFEMEFDIKVNGQNKDSLRLYEIHKKTGFLKLLKEEYPGDIVNGAEPGLLRGDRVTAFNSLSMLDFLPAVPRLGKDIRKRLGDFDKAMEIQEIIEQINQDNPVMSVTRLDADSAQLKKPKYGRLADQSGADIIKRVEGLQNGPPPSAHPPPKKAI